MKSIYNLLITLIVFFFIGCKAEKDIVPERNQLKISTGDSLVVLDQNNLDKVALTFTWTAAQAISPEYSFTYILRLDIADNKFETAIDPITMGDGVFTASFKTGDLYDYIVEKWHGVAGQETLIEARIVAKVNGPTFMYPEIATTKVTVKTYLPESKPLYVLGTATVAGLDPTKAIKMNEISNGKIYSWRGQLLAGNLKFITTIGSILPSLNRGEQDSLLVIRNSENDPDNSFTVNQSGMYYMYLSRKTMKINISLLKYQNIYIVGNATSAEWSIENAIEMIPDPLSPSIFTLQTILKAGDFKMPTARSWSAPTFRPMVANGPITETATQVLNAADGSADIKWTVTAAQAGTYKITLDTEKNKIYIVKI
jgi:uncharacterized protein (DUF2147 family)